MNVFIRESSPWMLISNIITASSEMQETELLSHRNSHYRSRHINENMYHGLLWYYWNCIFWSVDFGCYGPQTLHAS